MPFFVLSWLVGALLSAGGALASEDVHSVDVRKNKKLSDESIIDLSGIDQDPSLSDLEVTRRLQTTGLFSRVLVHRSADAMTITVDEKTNWFVVPCLSFDSSSSIAGLAAGKASLFQGNGSLIGRVQAGPTNQEGNVLLRDEFFLNSLWIAGVSGDFENSLHAVYQDRTITRRTSNSYYGTSIQTGYHLNPFFSLGFNTYLEAHHFEAANLEWERGFQVSHRAILDYGNFYVNEGLSRGAAVRGYIEGANPLSDFYFQKVGASGQISAFLQKDMNWIVRPKIEVGRQLPYYQRFEVGGSTLRSFPTQMFRDSAYGVIQNDFFLMAIPAWSLKLRPLVYADLAYIEGSGRTGVGAGVELFLSKVAIPALQCFAGYGFNPNGFTAMLAIGPHI